MELTSTAGRPVTERTADMWSEAVLRSIGTMREHLGDDLSLRTLAQAAWLSPFHFHRIFHRLTDSTPARFLAAWRIAEAKRLLAYSDDSVTDVCMHVGYASLGTFTSQFTRVVGVPPGRFRRLVQAYADVPFHDILQRLAAALGRPEHATVTVSVGGGPGDGALAVVGLFDSAIPQRRPAGCAVLRTPGTARLDVPPETTCQPLAMCFDRSVTVREAVAATDLDRCYVAAAPGPVRVEAAGAPIAVDLPLRRRRPTDPPILLALPLLMAVAGADLEDPPVAC
ncbi:helix-turn-helix domain-containing protein [Couchioplanes azureus]|uniref:helix-turn-helix domain-containing protein n=1 Tax=Couchioplanes caeruleus TaxID=56438 RepID=UPI001670D73B|nr:AraC family transcriptional regulator [Couchioplanes caeruleus]GGQ49180.1 AraC family transcriptional regulator [Couchioplanes caeruleus subsp. azureus]